VGDGSSNGSDGFASRDGFRARRGASFWSALGAGALHAILLGLAFPPFGWWGLALLAPFPLIWTAATHSRTEASGFLARTRVARWLWRWRGPLGVTLGVMPLWAYESQWVMNVSEAGYLPMVPGLAMFAGGFVCLLARVRRRVQWIPLWIAAPVMWCGLEVFRGEVVVTGYAWLILGQPLINWVVVAPVASIVGMYGVSFLAIVPASIVCAIFFARERAVRAGVVALSAIGVAAFALALAVMLSGSRVPWSSPAGGSVIRVAVVQTNIPQDNKMSWSIPTRERDFARMLELTRQAAMMGNRKPDLIAWPETMFPGEMLEPIAWPDGHGGTEERPLASRMVESLLAMQREIDVPLMVGALGVEGGRIVADAKGEPEFTFASRFNSVFLIRHGALEPARYDKMELTPFGEVMPYVHHWPWLERMVLGVAANGMKFDLTAGREARTFFAAASGARIGLATPICFEITKTAHCRRLLASADGSGGFESRVHPAILLNLSNDGWFGSFTPGKSQHLLAARWRAAELGVPVVRSVNTGISCFIDAWGRVMTGESAGPGASNTDGVFVADLVVPGGDRTIYARVGNVLGWTSTGVTIAFIVLTFVRRWQTGGAPRHPSSL
jgi:apolipoprotein N-acyltransferase